MRILRWVSDNTLRDRIRNEYSCRQLKVSPIKAKIREMTEIVLACARETNKCNN